MRKCDLPTLEEFLKRERWWPNNSYVREPGFKSLYIRDTRRRLGDSIGVVQCIDIPYVVASYPGKGAFSKLIARLNAEHNIYIESVMMDYFKDKLLRMGFKKAKAVDSFYLLKGELK